MTMNSAKPPIVIFDLDGTLIDSASGVLLSLASALQSSGITLNKPLDPSLIGPPLREMILSLVPNASVEQVRRITESFQTHYDTEGYKSSLPYPGIASTLQHLFVDQVQMHIVTNKRARPAQLILSHLQWTKYFVNVYSPDSFEPPHASKAELLGALLRDAGLVPEKCIYVGDRSEDWHAASANKVRFAWARWGYSGEELHFDDNTIYLSCPSANMLKAHFLD